MTTTGYPPEFARVRKALGLGGAPVRRAEDEPTDAEAKDTPRGE